MDRDCHSCRFWAKEPEGNYFLQTPLVSLVMPAWNAATWLPLSLGSVFAQSVTDWELLIADDGSTDATLSLLRRIQDPRVRVFTETHRGVSWQRNRLRAEARGAFTACVDADDMMHPSRLRKQLEFLERNPDVDGAGTGFIHTADNFDPLNVLCYPATHEDICADPVKGIRLHQATFMGRREWWTKYRYNDTNRCTEDWELWAESYPHSRFANLQDVLYYYRATHQYSIRWFLRTRPAYARLLWKYRSRWGTPLAIRKALWQIVQMPAAFAMPLIGGFNFYRGPGVQQVAPDVVASYVDTFASALRHALSLFGDEALTPALARIPQDSVLAGVLPARQTATG